MREGGTASCRGARPRSSGASASSRTRSTTPGASERRKLASRQPKLSGKVSISEWRVWIVSASPIGSPKSTSPPGSSGSTSVGCAVANHHRRHRQLVEDRAQRVGDAEARRRVEVAPGGRDVHRARPRRARAWPSAAIRFVFPGAEPMPEQREEARALEVLVELELLASPRGRGRRGRGSGSRRRGMLASRRG